MQRSGERMSRQREKLRIRLSGFEELDESQCGLRIVGE